MTESLSFTPIKSPTKKRTSQTYLRDLPICAEIPAGRTPVKNDPIVAEDLFNTPTKEEPSTSSSAPVFRTPVKEMSTMERLNSPVKREEGVAKDKPILAKV